MELLCQRDQAGNRERGVDGDTLDHRTNEGVELRWVVLGLRLVDERPQEGVLAHDTPVITGSVLLPIPVLFVLVVAAAGYCQGIAAAHLLPTRGDVEPGVCISGRVGEVEIDPTDSIDSPTEACEVNLHDMTDRDAEVGFDGLYQLIRSVVIGGIDPVVVPNLTGVAGHGYHRVPGNGQHSDLTSARVHVENLDHVTSLAGLYCGRAEMGGIGGRFAET